MALRRRLRRLTQFVSDEQTNSLIKGSICNDIINRAIVCLIKVSFV